MKLNFKKLGHMIAVSEDKILLTCPWHECNSGEYREFTDRLRQQHWINQSQSSLAWEQNLVSITNKIAKIPN